VHFIGPYYANLKEMHICINLPLIPQVEIFTYIEECLVTPTKAST